MLNYIRSIVVYHLQKKYKKRFFVNNQKYLLYFVLLGIFCTFSNCIVVAKELTSQESISTENTAPQKKHKSRQSKKAQTQSKTAVEKTMCPHAGIPVEQLNSIELAEVLAYKKAQKDKLENQVENLEQLIEEVETLETKAGKPYIINRMIDAPRCPYSNMPLKKLKAEQLEEVYAYTQKNKMDSPFIIDLLERLIALSDNHAGVKQYKLQLADTHYQVHHLEKAAACYEDFAVLYPGSNENEYVLYKAVLCMFELSLDADRDQTNTKKTITLIKEFLKHAKKSELIQEAQEMLQKCYDRLYDHEVYVFNFYLKNKKFVAAQLRLDYITKTFTETIKNLDQKVADLTAQFELKKNPVKPSKQFIINKLLA